MEKKYENILQQAAAVINLLLGIGFLLSGIGMGGGLVAQLGVGVLGIIVGLVLLCTSLVFFRVIK